MLAHVASDVIVKTAVPWMQMQLQQLEAQISQTRKGFRNQLKYLWRKPRDSAGSTQSGAVQNGLGLGIEPQRQQQPHDTNAVYPLHTVEGQMRLAGDLAFLLRDYETALGYYRNVVSDFKQDQSWKHAAGAYEMWGICTYVTGAPRSEWSRCMESAYNHYLQAAAGRHAMRAVALHQAMCSDYKEAASRLMKVNGDMSDQGLRSALVLEQAGQLFCQAGSMRKGTFHVVLAGHTFNKLGFKRLALYSYHSVVDHYADKKWFHITDHFHFTMARQAFGLGLLQESMSHFMKLLNSFAADKRVSIQAEREATYLKEFLFVVRNWMDEKGAAGGKRSSVDLQVPCIGPDILVRLLGDVDTKRRAPAELQSAGTPGAPPPPPPFQGSWGQGLAAVVEERALEALSVVPWEKLGERVLPAISPEDRLELQWRHQRKDRIFDSLRRVTAVGVEVCVELELSNPMRVKLELSQVQLGGDLDDVAGPGQAKALDTELASEASTDIGTEAGSAIDFPTQTVVLEPLERKSVKLIAIPQQEGLLRIRSISWSLFDQVRCLRPLFVKGRRLRNTLEQRSSAAGVYSTDHRLELKVRKSVPQLRAQFEDWPRREAEPLLVGELRVCALAIAGFGAGGLGQARSIRIATSHPAFLSFDSSAAAVQVAYDGEVLVVHCGGELESLRIPATLRADLAGQHTIRLCILAEPAGQAVCASLRSEQRQWMTLEEQLIVNPSLSCSVRPSPSFQEAGRLIFACILENKASETLEVRRVRCISGNQELPLAEFVPTSTNHRAGPGQLVQLMFALNREGCAIPTSREALPGEAQLSLSSIRLLQASRAAAAPEVSVIAGSAGREGRAGAAQAQVPSLVDLIVEWCAEHHTGEVYALGVPCERPGVPPCPLDMHLLASESATLSPGLTVPVTLRVRNSSAAGAVSFYFVADAVPEFVWLGCERSEVIKLPPFASHQATLHAYFTSPGVFNLNRFRLFVVAMPPGAGAVPASEQAPLAFQFPFERLIHVRGEE